MNKLFKMSFLTLAVLGLFNTELFAQEVKSSNSQSIKLSGRVQLQHLFNNDIEGDAAKTNHGFRMRRVRLQAKAQVTPLISAKLQIAVRDNSPNLKDAEAKIKLFDKFYLRAGQFKVPVWREELRSSGKLLLVEKSEAAAFLADAYLTARQIGTEFGGKLKNGTSFAFNYSNGSGAGAREDAGRTKSMYVNNGKALSGRVNVPVGKKLQVGFSAITNSMGREISADSLDNVGSATAFAPDFNLKLVKNLEIEGGMAFGSFDKKIFVAAEDTKFKVMDVTARYSKALKTVQDQLGGISHWEFAAGFSTIDPNTDVTDDEYSAFRFGPAVYFGKKVRLQVNGEVVSYAMENVDSVLKVRSQLTVNL